MSWIPHPGMVTIATDDADTARPDAPVVYWRTPSNAAPRTAAPGDLLYVEPGFLSPVEEQ